MQKKLVAFIAVLICCSMPTLGMAANYNEGLAEKINQVLMNAPADNNFQIEAKILNQWYQEKKAFQVFDVRVGGGVEELYLKAHLPRSVYVPYNKFFEKENLDKLDANLPIVVACHAGVTEQFVVGMLRLLGFKDVYALEGGYAGWEKDYTMQGFFSYLIENSKKSYPLESSKK